MRIAIASDHGGFALKEELKAWLAEQGYEVEDFGCHSTDSCDYPDFAQAAARAVAVRHMERYRENIATIREAYPDYFQR